VVFPPVQTVRHDVWLQQLKGWKGPASNGKGRIMRSLKAILLSVSGALLLSGTAHGQLTNVWPPFPATKLEGFETNTDTVIVKASSPIGSVLAHAGEVGVRCREITDAGSGRRESGIIVDLTLGGDLTETLLIDYDELGALLDGLEYLGSLDWSVTPLSGFDAVFTTKGGFRATAFGSRRTGNIEYAVRSVRLRALSLVLTREQLGQLRSLVQQGKAKLDSLRKEK
jgi:hypothetical protein